MFMECLHSVGIFFKRYEQINLSLEENQTLLNYRTCPERCLSMEHAAQADFVIIESKDFVRHI